MSVAGTGESLEVTTAFAAEEAPGRGGHLTYRPHLDGVRTLAVYLVVAFHAGLGAFSGGFIGVDVFFVLSGFLVTSILVRGLGRAGRVQWRSFYSRRVRRILPAAIVTLLVVAFVYAASATPSEVLDAAGGFRAAFFYVANWYFIGQSTDYFAADVARNPVLHFWSLAVEEQFYLLWPVTIAALYLVAGRARRARWWVVRIVVAAGAVASLVAALRISGTDLDRAYYGTDTRAYQLLAGALIALTPQLLRLPRRFAVTARWAAAVALPTIVVLGSSLFEMSPITRGVWIALGGSVLIVALENARGGGVKRVLSARPVTYLGRISYGTYLWHWPLIIFLTQDRDIAPVRLFVIDCVAATGLAALSYKLLEHPIRGAASLDRYRVPVVVIGLSASIVLGALVMPVVLDSGNGTTAGASGSSSDLLDWRVARNDISPLPDCLGAPVRRCTVVRGSGKHILLMGDSVARMWIPAFTEIAKRESLTLSIAAFAGCPWQRSLQYGGALRVQTECEKRQNDWYSRVVPQLHPDIVFLAQHSYDDRRSPNRFVLEDGRIISVDSEDFERSLIAVSEAGVRALSAPGREIVFVEPVPGPPKLFNPVSCLSRGEAATECGFRASAHPTVLEQWFRRTAADDPSIEVVDLDQLVCPGRTHCDAVMASMIVWRDGAHVTATFSRSLAGPIDAILRQQGILG